MSFPVNEVRADFPVLQREVNGIPLAYLDSAASAQKPNAVIDAEATSEEKYITKQKLIVSADDMNTQEQLDAMDRNYDRRNQERWQNVLYFAVVSFSVVGIAIGSPIAIKNVHRLLSAA